MDKSLYTRPAKPLHIPVTKRREPAAPVPSIEVASPVIVDRSTECHVTPPDVAARMVQYLGPQGDYMTLEPSAGTGALVKALLASGHSKYELTTVERHATLCAELRKLDIIDPWQECFLEYADRARGKIEFPRIIMNPPFKPVRKHIDAALSLLGRKGHGEPARLVALVPITFERADAETLETLSADTFATARVNTKIIRIER